MAQHKTKCGLAASFLLLSCSSGQGFTYLYPASLATLYPAPAAYTGDLSLSLGEEADFLPSWHVAQWGIVEELPATINSLGNCHDNTWQVAISGEKALFEEWVRGAIAGWRQRRAPDFLKGAYQERDGRRFLLVDDVERRHLHKFAQLSIATLRGIPLPIIDPSLPENSFKQFHIINGLPVRIRDSQFLLASCHEGMFL